MPFVVFDACVMVAITVHHTASTGVPTVRATTTTIFHITTVVLASATTTTTIMVEVCQSVFLASVL